jgi:sugar O-acyltransferase (sialic acid O-acetyltransferase NeuD family)
LMVDTLRSESTMRRLYILGAGGFGREIFSWLTQLPEWGAAWEFGGFLDDNLDALNDFAFPFGVVGGIADSEVNAGDEFVCAIGDPRTRLRICRELRSKGARFPVIRHPFSVVGQQCSIGEGTIICPGAVITTNVKIGEFVVVNICATIGHDAQIGDGVTLSPHADVTGFATVGEGAFLGSHASIIPSAKVGAYSRVGAGSVVLRSVAAGATVVGVPAKQIFP